jgi:hypothetical protein
MGTFTFGGPPWRHWLMSAYGPIADIGRTIDMILNLAFKRAEGGARSEL